MATSAHYVVTKGTFLFVSWSSQNEITSEVKERVCKRHQHPLSTGECHLQSNLLSFKSNINKRSLITLFT